MIVNLIAGRSNLAAMFASTEVEKTGGAALFYGSLFVCLGVSLKKKGNRREGRAFVWGGIVMILVGVYGTWSGN